MHPLKKLYNVECKFFRCSKCNESNCIALGQRKPELVMILPRTFEKYGCIPCLLWKNNAFLSASLLNASVLILSLSFDNAFLSFLICGCFAFAVMTFIIIIIVTSEKFRFNLNTHFFANNN